jgi:NCS1 nucleoside transporter family
MSETMLERRSIDYVPLHERRGRVWHLWPIWFSGGAQLATVATGFLGVALGGNFIWMTLAVLLGCAFGTFFMAFHAAQGPQLGLPQMIQSRPQFGYLGALLVWCVALITLVGYSAFNQVLAADTLRDLAGWNHRLTIIGTAVLAVALASVGYELIHKAQRWLAYLLLVVFALLTLAVGRAHLPPGALDLKEFSWVPFLTQLFAAAAYQLTWAIYVSDYSRYLPRMASVRTSFWWTYLGCFGGGVWPMLIGVLAATSFPKLELASAVRATADQLLPGFGSPFLIATLLGLVTITTLNYYSASLTLLSVANSIRLLKPSATQRLTASLLLALISSSIALAASAHFTAQFSDFLALLLYLFTPWTAINLVDFYFVRRGHYSVREIFNPNGLYGRWNWRGLLAYFGGFAAMMPFMSTDLYRGPVARALGGADLAMLVGLPVATALYLLACRSVDFVAEARLASLADRGLESPAAEADSAVPDQTTVPPVNEAGAPTTAAEGPAAS